MRFLFTFLITILLLTSCSSSEDPDSQEVDNSAIEVTVTASVIDEGNGINGVDDIIEYTISIQNTGDVSLSSLSLVSSLKDFLNNSLELDTAPNFINASLGSTMGSIQASEIATYTARFTITQSEVDADGLSYSVTVNAMTPQNESVSDLSDNGDDSDGNSENDDTEINIEFDPLIIAEYHLLNSEGNPSNKYFFNADGRIKELHTTDTKFYFEFDNSQQLINITITDINNVPIESQDIVYGTGNRILSIGNRNFEFFETENYYIDSESYYSDGPLTYEDNGVTYEEYELWYDKYEVFTGNPIVKRCLYSGGEITNLTTNELQVYGDCSEFESNGYSNNVTNSCGDTDCVDYGYDTNPNPLFGDTNLIDVYGFIRNLTFGIQPSKLNILINANNLTLINYSDPSYILYDYEFNENNLPITGSKQYMDELGAYDINPYSRYYYQGDVITD
ncbi:DUF7507 domain-containing protein [Psychroserpens ponticola]|uniref:DUF7507 domain-containing protein n=1 Tax=Psychroserpens ponticola TaxID=2932268 RepID=A0ABY7RZ04_9FLAO|nr:hypothetical protein [Psychroserpens ponticola]WCO02268.1 hypothetical protein MUN68_001970 [Psychroserpens ponticola]